jgi:hypothetical protein
MCGLLVQAAQGVQHAIAVETGAGEQLAHPVQRDHICSRCRIAGHTGQDCPLLNEPDQVTCLMSSLLIQACRPLATVSSSSRLLTAVWQLHPPWRFFNDLKCCNKA